MMNDVDLIKFLVDNGARIDILDDYNRSILFMPIKYNYMDILSVLLEYNKTNIGIDITDCRTSG